jgi:hypothetical protein
VALTVAGARQRGPEDFERHITTRLQRPKELHQGWLIAPSFWDFAEVRRVAFFERLRLGFEVDFGVDVCRIERDVPEPSANRVDINTGAQQMGRGGVPAILPAR